MNNELIPFNLERALAGDEVITRNGRKVSQLTLCGTKDEIYPLRGVIDGIIYNFARDGKFYGDKRLKSKLDLFMASKGEQTMSDELIPFNLERALAGDKVITRDGRKVSQLTLFDAKDSPFPLCGVVDRNRYSFTKEGWYFQAGEKESEYDLFMAPKTRVIYANAWMNGDQVASRSYDTEEEAKAAARTNLYYLYVAKEFVIPEGK